MSAEELLEEIRFVQMADEELEVLEQLDRKLIHAMGLPESTYDRNKRMLQQVGAYNPSPLFSTGLLTEQGKQLFK